MPTGKKLIRTAEGRSRFLPAFSFFRPRRKGQAMTEMLLLLPLFMFIVFFTAKIFALLVLVQKLEIASFYAARRWQLESHLSVDYAGSDQGNLKSDIKDKVEEYIG
jgi:Flp pilus assembly protein TadG